MPMWTNMTLEEMRAEPLVDLTESIDAWIRANMTKREIMEWLFETSAFADPPEFIYDGQGRKTGRKQIHRYLDTGSQRHNAEAGYTYYPNGDVEDITIINRDENDDMVEHYTIHHYQDGRQPVKVLHELVIADKVLRPPEEERAKRWGESLLNLVRKWASAIGTALRGKR